MAWRLRPGWMVGVVPGGVVAVGPQVEIRIALGDGAAEAAAVAAGRNGPPGDEQAGGALRSLLADHGALTGEPPAPPAAGRPLAAALTAALAGWPPDGVVWTAEEMLVLPAGLPAEVRTRALRAFVAGLEPDGRLDAYALLSRGHGAVYGDVPREAGAIAAVAGDSSITVSDLGPPGRTWRVAENDLGRLGAGQAHRLGPILSTSAPVPVDAELPELQWCTARVAVGNLSAPTPARERTVQGVGDPSRARLVAHAEGAERFAAAELSSAELVWARGDELPGAVDPRSLYARRADPGPAGARGDEPRLWTPVTGRGGTRRWAPAETVYLSVLDPAPPEAIIPWTSSGLAAGLDAASARRRAFQELVERDAFMVAWLRGTSRERIAPRSVPDGARRMAAVLSTHGWDTAWVNLTSDTFPVILCCLTHPWHGLTVGAACDAQPAQALGRATVEALVLALHLRPPEGPPPPAHAVRTPRDHLLLHRDPARRPDHEFLYRSRDQIALSEIPDRRDDDLERQLEDLGHTPLIADLTRPAVEPYRVIRALAPGLVPLTFGDGTEATGLDRLRGAEPACSLPHPFP